VSGLNTCSLQETRSLGITRQLGQAIGLLKFSNKQLAAFLEFQAALNPFLLVERPSDPEKGARVAKVSAPTGASGLVESVASAPSGLLAHVSNEVRFVLDGARDREIAEYFIEALEPSGWLGASLEEIARSAGCGLREAEAVLEKIQGIDPAGLFARSLAECLRLQAISADELSPEMACVLENLPMLARSEIDDLAKLCGSERKSVMRLFERLRSYNPKPGAVFDGEAPVVTAPDLGVGQEGGGWRVDLNRSNLPSIRVQKRTGMSKDDRRLLDLALSVARAVERRNITTLRIAAEIVQRQAGFLKEGPTKLVPLSHRDIAAALGLHETTVSRVTTGLRIQTPAGTMALRDFLGAALAGGNGGASLSNKAIQARILAMIWAENPSRPMSDQAITDALAREGVRIARRTVAKYRERLKLASASDRRRQAILQQARRS